jgi:hypothetical protein
MADTNDAEKWAGLHVTPGRKDDKSNFGSDIGGYTLWQLQSNSYTSFFTYPIDFCPLEATCKRLWTIYLIETKKPHQQQILLI